MSDGSLISDELKSKIGVEFLSGKYEIEKGMIKRFVQAVDDPNPLWQDEEYAKKTKYGGIIAPPLFVVVLGFDEFEKDMASLIPARLHGGTEFEYFKPVRPGDVITVSRKVADIREREGKKLGKMAFVTFEMTYKNQHGELVAKCRQITIGYEPKGEQNA